ncbi:HypC/HybG/HupF family hydrogenase formation chaperone [Haloarcula halophila]|uniref:HypC/HybG/HupF family hydrogenase formation chaperone n=1 Tax=Haloarcula TaxID=2237 RepID=UPI0023E37182|nr:HypC/HybG/HupF family hydrogenase formation chaperone [Halomicroarcula sp. DFY41]
MCLGVPGEVVELDPPEARVDFGGAQKWIRVEIVGDDVCVGDHVLTHAGFAIRKIPEEQVERTVELYESAIDGAAPGGSSGSAGQPAGGEEP